MGNIITGSTPATDETTFYSGNRLFVSPADLQSNRYVFKTKTTLTEKGFNKGRKIRRGSTYFVCIGSTIGKVGQATEDSITNQQINSVIPVDNDDDFVFSLLEYSSVKIKSLSAEQAVPIINKTTFSNIIVAIPNIEEQEKISSLFKLLDERIQTQRKIISQLKSQMSNLKDLLFEQQLRFTDDKGNEFADWQENKLEDICEKQSSSISANKIEDNIGDYPIYGATGILKNVDFYEVENDYVSIVKDGAGVGRLLYCKGKSSVLGTLDIIQSKNINLYFIFLLLSRIDFKKYITGSTIPHIYFKDYKKEKFQIPSIEEQEKIANFFKSLDAKINLETELLTQYENQKKHLLQNLFI